MATATHLTDHDRILGNLRRPPALVATKPDSSSSELFEGESADPRHHSWVIRCADPKLVMNSDWPLDFSQPVAEGVLLTDASSASDLLTVKLAAIEALRGQYLSLASGQQIQSLAYHICWIVRWRKSLGVPRIQDITPSMFDAFCDGLRQGGFASLIPVDYRVRRLGDRIRGGEWTWPVRHLYEGPGGRRPDYRAIGAELGVPLQTVRTEPIRRQVRALIRDTAPKLFRFPDDDDNDAPDEDDDAPGERGLSVGTVRHVLRAWRTLHHLSAIGVLAHDPLVFDPFDRVDLAARARQIAPDDEEDGRRTATLEPEKWLALLDGAARWVLDYASPIMTICKEAYAEQLKIFGEHPTRSQRKRPSSVKRFRANAQAIIDKHLPADRPGVPRLMPQWRRPGIAVTKTKRGRKSAVEIDRTGIFLDEALGHVVAACLILSAGFSARRASEVSNLQAGCANKDPAGSGQWLMTSYIEKTVQDCTAIPIPASVAYAVQLLEEASQSTRQRDGTKWLTKIYRPGLLPGENHEGERSFLKTRLNLTLNEFAEVIGLRGTGHENEWDFKPHQLRRAFSIYYYHAYRYSSLDALSRFLRHWDPEMTLRYITEVMGGAMMRLREIIEARSEAVEDEDERVKAEARAAHTSLSEWAKEHENVRQNHFVSRTLEVYDGVEAPIGRGAATLIDELEEMIEDCRRGIRVVGPSNISPDDEREALIVKLRRHAPRRYIEPHPGRHAHCGCDPHDPSQTAQAVCLRNRQRETGADPIGRPDFAYASVADCYGCGHCIAFSQDVEVADRRMRNAEDAAAKAPSERFRTAAQTRLEAYKTQLAASRDAVQNRKRIGS